MDSDGESCSDNPWADNVAMVGAAIAPVVEAAGHIAKSPLMSDVCRRGAIR
jgi:hypothetical protein